MRNDVDVARCFHRSNLSGITILIFTIIVLLISATSTHIEFSPIKSLFLLGFAGLGEYFGITLLKRETEYNSDINILSAVVSEIKFLENSETFMSEFNYDLQYVNGPYDDISECCGQICSKYYELFKKNGKINYDNPVEYAFISKNIRNFVCFSVFDMETNCRESISPKLLYVSCNLSKFSDGWEKYSDIFEKNLSNYKK